MKTLLPAVTAISVLAMAARGPAAELGVQISAEEVMVGDNFEVRIAVSGLTASGAPSLAAFDVDLTFDSGRVQFVSSVFGDPAHEDDALDLLGFRGGDLVAVGDSDPRADDLRSLHLEPCLLDAGNRSVAGEAGPQADIEDLLHDGVGRERDGRRAGECDGGHSSQSPDHRSECWTGGRSSQSMWPIGDSP